MSNTHLRRIRLAGAGRQAGMPSKQIRTHCTDVRGVLVVKHLAHLPYIWLHLQGQRSKAAWSFAVIACLKIAVVQETQKREASTSQPYLAEAVEQVEGGGWPTRIAAHPWLHIVHAAVNEVSMCHE